MATSSWSIPALDWESVRPVERQLATQAARTHSADLVAAQAGWTVQQPSVKSELAQAPGRGGVRPRALSTADCRRRPGAEKLRRQASKNLRNRPTSVCRSPERHAAPSGSTPQSDASWRRQSRASRKTPRPCLPALVVRPKQRYEWNALLRAPQEHGRAGSGSARSPGHCGHRRPPARGLPNSWHCSNRPQRSRPLLFYGGV